MNRIFGWKYFQNILIFKKVLFQTKTKSKTKKSNQIKEAFSTSPYFYHGTLEIKTFECLQNAFENISRYFWNVFKIFSERFKNIFETFCI